MYLVFSLLFLFQHERHNWSVLQLSAIEALDTEDDYLETVVLCNLFLVSFRGRRPEVQP